MRRGLAECFEDIAAIAHAHDDATTGAQLLGAADATRRAIGAAPYPVECARLAALRTSILESLGEEGAATELTAGEALTLDEAVNMARMVLAR